jgi:TRAP transporter TAXI family solute receptor
VQNVIDASRLEPAAAFTASPSLIQQARKGEKPFEPDPRYEEIRGLFTVPYVTVHWIVRADAAIRSVRDLAGSPFIPGTRGSVAERLTASVLKAMDIEDKVPMIDVDAATAIPALKEGKVAGIALAGAYPLPSIVDLANEMPIRLIGLGKDDLPKVLADDDSIAAVTIPKGTYPKVDESVTTIARPTGLYATSEMSEAVAYAITKAFWTTRAKLARQNPQWLATTPDTLSALGAKLHPGALRYYTEAGLPIPPLLR